MKCQECKRHISSARQLQNPKKKGDYGKLVCNTCFGLLSRSGANVPDSVKRQLESYIIVPKLTIGRMALIVREAGQEEHAHGVRAIARECYDLYDLQRWLNCSPYHILALFEKIENEL